MRAARIVAIAFSSLWLDLSFGCDLSLAQNVNDLVNILGGFARSAIVQATHAEWRKLPPNEIACIDQAMRQQGASVAAVIQSGITPSDQRILNIRLHCEAQLRRDSASIPTAPAKSMYSVDGISLANRLQLDSAIYREYQCAPSRQFAGYVWCQKKRVERESRGQFTSYYSILHSSDGVAVYVNRYLEPAFFTGNEAEEEISRLSKKHGTAPRVLPLPQNSRVPYGAIAVWGSVGLERLDANRMNDLAAGP